MNRREFVRLMGLATGASVLDSCGGKPEKIIPYVIPPDDGTIPGVATHYATACQECPAGCGASAKVIDHQAGKLEGAANHPINDGALCARGQASLGRLRHPQRLTQPLARDASGGYEAISWDEAYDRIAKALDGSKRHAFLSGQTTGTLSGLIGRFCDETRVERLPEYELYSNAAIREANRIVLGRNEVPAYRIDNADFLLTIGADVFETFTNPVSHAVQLGRAKRKGHFNWYHVEPHLSLAGVQAEHRYVITPGTEVFLLAFLVRRLSRENVAGERHIAGIADALPDLSPRAFAEKIGLTVEEIEHLAEALLRAKRPLVITGGVSTMQSSGLDVAVLTSLLQWAAGMVGSTVDFTRAHRSDDLGSVADLERLSRRLANGEVGTLFLADVDPLETVPAALGLRDDLARAELRVGIGDVMNATVETCDLILPLSHTLESWGDAEPQRGIVNVIQPVVEPLHDTRTLGDVLLGIMAKRKNQTATPYQQYLFARWKERFGERNIEKLLVDGFLVLKTAESSPSLDREGTREHVRRMSLRDGGVKPVLVVAPSIRVYDGRSKDLPLLSEIPDPLTTITWGAWVSVSPTSANEMGLREREEVEVSSGDWSFTAPVKIQKGLPRGVITVQRASVDPTPAGVIAASGEANAVFEGIDVRGTGKIIAVPVLAGSQSQQGRGVIPHGNGGAHGEHSHGGAHATLYPDNPYPEYRWGMAIDMDLCIGCSACAAACYVENNVPVVGPEMHLQGREMSWLRIEPFYDDDGEAQLQPMLCQHCANAPCETVCPVYATYHNPEGLNAQIYNRCVGTRYCANNCPYKVRRFNWFDFHRPGELNTTRNPEVSIRGKGVMEKCSFCVQRIRAARDHAKDEGRLIADGEVVPACAQTCPTKAIRFGNLLDDAAEVTKQAKSDRAYRVFDTLGTGPAVNYLKSKWKNDHA